MFDENTKQQKTYIKMIKYKTKEEVLKDIEEHLTPWDQKELADEVVSKYGDLNEYIDNNKASDNNIGTSLVFDKYGKYLLEKKNEILQQFLLKGLSKNNDIISGLRTRKELDGKVLDRINELEEECKLISEALDYYEI